MSTGRRDVEGDGQGGGGDGGGKEGLFFGSTERGRKNGSGRGSSAGEGQERAGCAKGERPALAPAKTSVAPKKTKSSRRGAWLDDRQETERGR